MSTGHHSLDSGAELFGDATTKSNGKKAVDGFDAIADLDSNHDGKIDAQDAQFANLRVWRDLNQDGVSQSTKLFTLSALGIQSINVAKQVSSTLLENGNVVADLGTFTRTNGSTGTAGSAEKLADINLAVEPFPSQFADHLDTSRVANLPDMSDAGQVRNLREAATLSPTLDSLLAQFSAATDRAMQAGLIDAIVKAWADTPLKGLPVGRSTMKTTFMGAYDRRESPWDAGHALTVDMQGVWSPDDVRDPNSAAYKARGDGYCRARLTDHASSHHWNP